MSKPACRSADTSPEPSRDLTRVDENRLTSDEQPVVSAQALDVLDRVFGFASLRPGQEDVVAAILGGADVLAVMPTGA